MIYITIQLFTTTHLQTSCLYHLHQSPHLQVGSIFDGISYYKGSAVVRMLNHVVGDEAFKRGMNLYLTKYAYGNARHTDLVKVS